MSVKHPSSNERIPIGSPYIHALRTSVESLPPDLITYLQLSIDTLLATAPKTYSIYEPLLLLPAHAFASPSWSTLLQNMDAATKKDFFAQIAWYMKVTHVALNAPISPILRQDEVENVQRRPNIAPLHADFGPFVTSEPTAADFNNAFWVSTRQNGITQVWAPLYTMFSRGNITEKARLLALPSVLQSVEEANGCTAIDLYAGIGYFAFSYAKAKCKLILGFEINAWSVEGLRRGAKANKWHTSVVTVGNVDDAVQTFEVRNDLELVVFQMSNELAPRVVDSLRKHAPPVRHVNLGLLPTSRGAWRTAVQCLCPEDGGWLHVHENFATKDIFDRAVEATEEMGREVRDFYGENWRANLDHVEKVKTYAPGVMHCVMDIHVFPSKESH